MGKCNEKMEVYSRIVGYYRPIQDWNKGKKAEFDMRKTFKMPSTEKDQCIAINLDDDDSVQNKTDKGKSVFTPDS